MVFGFISVLKTFYYFPIKVTICIIIVISYAFLVIKTLKLLWP